MHAGQNAHLSGQRADLVDAAAVHALALIQQPAAHHELLHLVAYQIQIGSGQVGVFLGDLVHDGQQGCVTHILVIGVHSGLEVVQILVLDGVEHVHVQTHNLEVDLRLAALGHDLVDELDDLLDLNVCGLDGGQHGILVHLVGAGLDHHDLVHGGGNGQGKVAHLALLLRGVQHDLAVNQTHLHAADGAVPRDIGHGGHQRSADHAGDLRAAIRVKAHDGHGDAHVVAHLLGEQRAHGAVHHAAGQDGALAGAALTAHKAAGNAACGVELFLVLHVQREEIHALAGLGAHDHVAHHAGLAVADQCAGIGQATHLAHFNLERAAGQHGFVDLEVVKGLFAGTKFDCHCFCLLVFRIVLSKKLWHAHYSNKSSVPARRHGRSIYCCNTLPPLFCAHGIHGAIHKAKGRYHCGTCPPLKLLTQTQSCDQSTVTLDVLLLEVGQQIAAAANHLHQTTAAVVIVRVLLQVLVQLVDVSGQQSDLDFGGASVLLGQSDFGHNFLLVHSNIPLYKILCANGTAAGNGIPKSGHTPSPVPR